LLFDAEVESQRVAPALPPGRDPQSMAQWTRAVLAGRAPVPGPLVHQIACCLHGSGGARTLHEAKALVAVGSGLAAA
jgi:anthranilate phosphoribosyltransferase